MKAVSAFLEAINLDPDNGEYERGLGWAMFNRGNRAKGITHLYRALELSPSNKNVSTKHLVYVATVSFIGSLVLRNLIPNSRNCISVTSAGEFINGHAAVCVFGKAITSRIEVE